MTKGCSQVIILLVIRFLVKLQDADSWSLPSCGLSSTSSLFLGHKRSSLCLTPDSQANNSEDERSKDKAIRHRRKIRLSQSGKEAFLLSRTLPITSEWSITIWEWESPAQVIEAYWEAQQEDIFVATKSSSGRKQVLLDPFGLVTWPGSVVAAQALYENAQVVKNQRVLILGAGVGVEAQMAAMLGASHVLATDIHPTALQQLELGIQENPQIPDSKNTEQNDDQSVPIVETQILDLFDNDTPIPISDLLIVADVLYNEQLASQVVSRLVEALLQNEDIRILVTDSQRFVDIRDQLNICLEQASSQVGRSIPAIKWVEETLPQFTGSGVCIDEDQTYDVKVRTLWIGLD